MRGATGEKKKKNEWPQIIFTALIDCSYSGQTMQ